MNDALRRAWTEIVTAEDYELHMAAVGQAQAAARLTVELIEAAALAPGSRIAFAGAGTGQMFEYLDSAVLQPFSLTATDLNPIYLARFEERLRTRGLTAKIFVDDFEQTALTPGADLLLATLLFEHIDFSAGIRSIARVAPAACGIILQENPPGMETAVTPGRTVPPSIELALRNAHASLVRCDALIGALQAAGYENTSTRTAEVADGKRLVSLLFILRTG